MLTCIPTHIYICTYKYAHIYTYMYTYIKIFVSRNWLICLWRQAHPKFVGQVSRLEFLSQELSCGLEAELLSLRETSVLFLRLSSRLDEADSHDRTSSPLLKVNY